LPELNGRGIKLAQHIVGSPADPQHIERATAEDAAPLEQFLARHLPDAVGPLADVGVCLYENSPDGHFVIDTHPHCEHVVLACGFSGHGFKFAPVIGEVLADLALTGSSRLPVKFLTLARFAA
jgi:glycine/D-amino acid oxidase-like deaminating enzyme